MRLFNGVIGVLSLFGAFYCIFLQGTSFLNYGWIVTLVLLLWGICAVITYAVDRKEKRKKDPNLAMTGAIGMIFGIAMCIISVMALFNPLIQAQFLLIVFVIFVGFMFVSGIRTIAFAFKTKKSAESGTWVVSLILGIIMLLIGTGGLISWLGLSALSGVTMGVMLGVFGCALIASVFEHDVVDRYDEL